MQNNEYVSIKDAAKLIGIPEITLRRWSKKGRVPHLLTPTGRLTYKISDLEEFQKKYPMFQKESGKWVAK
jgi:predicted site-specific integrase-resolvase